MDKYIYTINYSCEEKAICKLEMKSIFGIKLESKLIVSDIKIDPSRSTYIKERIDILYTEKTLNDLKDTLKEENISIEDFKVNFIKGNTEIEYKERLSIIKRLGMCINGEADIKNPKVEFGVININDKWVFGKHIKHNNDWRIHDKKPCNYSNSLNYKTARSLINIAIGNDQTKTIIDPCCGVGTVLIEGVSLGYNIKGYEINPLIGERAKINLRFFDYEDVVEIKDMHTSKEVFDIAIVDIPYGLFNPITKEEQEEIIKTSRKISKKMVIISYEEMDNLLELNGFRIVDKCSTNKGKFKRYITVCDS